MSHYGDIQFNEAEKKAFRRIEQQQAQQTPTTTNSAINPSHYKTGGIEAIDYMRAKSTPEEFRGHLRLTALKYLSRYGHKDDQLQELKKAVWYINELIDELEK